LIHLRHAEHSFRPAGPDSSARHDPREFCWSLLEIASYFEALEV